MTLADEFDRVPTEDAPPWEQKVEFDGTQGFVQTGPLPVNADVPKVIAGILRDIGYDPDHLHIGRTIKNSHWQQRARKREWSDKHQAYIQTDEFETVWLHAVKVEIETSTFPVDLPALYAEVEKTKKNRTFNPRTGPSTIVVCYADIQTGKTDHLGGLRELLERLDEKRDRLTEYLKHQNYDHIVITDCGDIIEGFQNFDAQTRTNCLSIMDQVDVAATEMWKLVKQCAQSAPVDVYSIPSNHCVDADTEILTPTGWVRVEDFNGLGEIAAYNPEFDSLEWQPVLHWTAKPYCGDMFHVTNRTVDHMVTPDHDLYGRGLNTSRRKSMVKIKASEASLRRGWEFLQTAGSWEGKPDFPAPNGFDVLSSDPLLAARFYGWYVSEGSTYIHPAKVYQVVISQSKVVHPEYYDEIRDTWHSLGRSASLGPKTLTVGSKKLALFLREHFGCTSGEKRLPAWLKDAPADVLEEFMRSYLLGDGYNELPTWSKVASKSKRLMDDLQEVCLKLGWRMVCDQTIQTFPFRGTRYIGSAYVGYINKRRRGTNIRWMDRGRANGTWVAYNGMVYCPTVSSGLWFARRNGKVVVTGNCRWAKGKSLIGKTTDDWGLHVNKRLERHNEEVGLPVQFHRAQDWMETLEFDVRNSRIGLAHGHQVNNPNQIPTWWSKMTHAGVLSCDILVTGHFHFPSLRPSGKTVDGRSKWHIQASTLDNGSSWVRNKYGEDGDPALTVFRVDDQGFDVGGFALL